MASSWWKKKHRIWGKDKEERYLKFTERGKLRVAEDMGRESII